MRKNAWLFLLVALYGCSGGVPRYNGYIDADLTYLSSDSPGRLVQLAVVRGQSVEKKQFLFKLEQTSESFGVKISQLSHDNLAEQLKVTENQLHYAELNYRRTTLMRKDNAASQNELDVAKKDRDVLLNQLAGLKFQMKSSQIDTKNKQWQRERKEGFATDSGIIFDTYFTKGEYAQAGQPVLALITKRNIKVIFFVPESSLAKLSLNQNVLIKSDGNPTPLQGKISYIANTAQYTSPLIYSRENRQSLLFCIEARIEHPDLRQIHLGQPVTLELAR